VYRRRGKLLPITFLNEVLGLNTAELGGAMSIVVLQAEDRQYGLVVDSISDTQEIVVKPLGKQLKGLSLYAGATIMGDGRVALILDAQGIGHASQVLGETQEQLRSAAGNAQQAKEEKQRLLLFRSGSHARIAIPLPLVGRLEEFPRTSIEHAGDVVVVQYRHRILPLIVLRTVLDGEAAHDDSLEDPVPVIVIDDGTRQLGLAVDEIVDVAEQAVTIRQKSEQKWFLGSAVVGSRVTEFLDVEQLLRCPVAGWFQNSCTSSAGRTVLLGDGSAFARSLLRGSLEMSGYSVTEATNLDEALRALEQRGADAMLVSRDLPPHGAHALVEAIHSRPEWSSIPVFEVSPWNGERGSLGDERPDEGSGGRGPSAILSFLSGLPESAPPEALACAGGARTNR
jgi:two-component system chemotaxis sensor kinase CheA